MPQIDDAVIAPGRENPPVSFEYRSANATLMRGDCQQGKVRGAGPRCTRWHLLEAVASRLPSGDHATSPTASQWPRSVPMGRIPDGALPGADDAAFMKHLLRATVPLVLQGRNDHGQR